ncbi:hypothetical protein PISS_b0656 [Pseudoalteromonas issachenkonii]|uniref:Uncharacterized protein n=1 Tax=Pseudoalteromonas issachenkonii TaxID=152297 RepID=A0ABN5CET5_9GAMM|nr:hypothetical protein PISS_b0656 [Pseudoalteromonas issachenkonii]
MIYAQRGREDAALLEEDIKQGCLVVLVSHLLLIHFSL